MIAATRPNFPLAAVAALALAALGGCAASTPRTTAAASAPSIHVSPEQVLAPVRPAVLLGFNFSNSMEIADFAGDLRKIAPAQLRFPGGNVGDENDLLEYPLDIFKTNLSMLQGEGGAPIPTMIQTRVFQGTGISKDPPRNTPADAGRAVKWARARGIVVPYWEIGNEPDLFAVTRGDASWTPERYCEVFRAQARAIKEVDPQAKVAGPAVSGAVPVRDVFLERFVEKCGDAVDVLTWHLYPTDGTMEDGPALDTVSQVDDTVSRFRALLADPQRNPLGHRRQVALGVTEYGLSWFTNRARHLADIYNAMWAAEVALRLDEQGAEVAHYFALQGLVNHGLLDQSGIPRPTYYAFGMLGKLEGQLVSATTGDPQLWTHAAVSGQRLHVLATNRSAVAKTLSTAVAGYRLTGGEWFDAAIADQEKPMAKVKAAATAITLAPNSMTHLVYQETKR